MKKSIRILGWLLLACLCVSLFAGCGNTDTPNDTPTTTASAGGEITTGSDLDPKLPKIDFAGDDFTVLYNGGTIEPNLDFIAEEPNGTALNDAIYKRNMAIQEKYNLTIVPVHKSDSEGDGAVRIANGSGSEPYQMVEMTANTSMAMAVKGYLYPYSALNLIDTSKPYWFSTALAGSSIKGENYFAYCDANIYSFAETPCTIFNKTVHNDFRLDNIYDLVRNRNWTFEEMTKMDKIVTDSGFDGDPSFSKDDRMGLIANSFCVDCFFSGTGYQMITKDEEDLPVLNIQSENYQNILDAITALCSEANGCFLCNRFGSSTEALQYWTEQAITANRALFWIGNFFCVERMRVTECDYGVVPIPMLNKDQGDYKIHMQADNGGAISVPISVQDPEAISSVIEDVAYLSSKNDGVMPVYMEVLISGQSLRDVESLECIKIIRNSYYCDLAFMMKNYGVNLLLEMRKIVEDGKPAASFITSVSESYQNRLKQFRDAFKD